MGTAALRQLLKSLCNNSPWRYAVLWKLRHQNPLNLTWEDGFYVYPRPSEPKESMSNDMYSSGSTEIASPYCESSIHDSSVGGYPVEALMASMSHLQFAWGEGAVGEVANSGKHCWVCIEEALTGKVASKLVPEFPEEWLLQFASGIKTIVLVPVPPHGVLQLGSLEMVNEDLELISYVKERFALYSTGENTISLFFDSCSQEQTSSSLVCSFAEKFNESSTTSFSPLKSDDSKAVDGLSPDKPMLLDSDQVVPQLNFLNELLASRKDLLEIRESASENKIQPVGLAEVSSPLSESMIPSQLELVESKLFGLSCFSEEIQPYPEYDNYSMKTNEELFDDIMKSWPTGDLVENPLLDKNDDDTSHKTLNSFLSFPSDCELHKALGPAFQRQGNEYWDSSFLGEDVFSAINGTTDGIEPARSFKGGDAGYLLQAVVANICDSLDDTSSNISNHAKSSTTSKAQFAVASQHQSARNDSVALSQFTSTFGAKSALTTATSASFKRGISTVVDEEQQEKGYYNMQSRKGPKQSNVSKRTRPADNQRPRPRDRQMIQDRVKELRELVPDGAKCSIDGLLDRTIKHMLYLRGMTNQAEKLRQWVHQEVAGRKNFRSSETKDGYQNGASWAFEIGSELKVCPIVVEDLAYPGHLLIEMLCNEHGLFLEIAQVIRSFNLTILKGAMESCANNTWAHFIVEASRGFHRLDIFWPLMQLLQRKRNPISSKI